MTYFILHIGGRSRSLPEQTLQMKFELREQFQRKPHPEPFNKRKLKERLVFIELAVYLIMCACMRASMN